ncbi:MAG TPA: hypothetical protein VFL14_08525, partial [Xanthomonadales bacterium]|nr:hypothetical protein [Xanthomonadales bacterium]
GADQSATTAVAFVLALASIAVLLRGTFEDDRLGSVQRAAIACFVALALFWLGNGRMLVQTSEMLNVQFALLALLLGAGALVRAQHGRAAAWSAAAAACATAATFTFGPGIAAFPALLAVAVAIRVPWRGVASFALALPLVLWLYLFAMPGDEGVRGNLVVDPLVNLRQAMQWLGAPQFTAWLGLDDPVADPTLRGAIVYQWGGNALLDSARAISAHLPAQGGWLSSSTIVGAIGLFAAAAIALRTWWRRRDAMRLEAMALALALFGAGVAFVIALGRHDLFAKYPGQIFADRYLPWSCLFWLGLAIAAVRALPQRWGALAGVAAISVAALAYPIHAVQAGWAESFSLLAERGAIALRLGVWDEQVMPWPAEATRPQVQRTMALLREWDGTIWQGLPERDRVLVPGNQDTAGASTLAVARTFVDPETNRTVLVFEGHTTWPQRAGELLVVDAAGRFRGLGLLHGRHDWRDLVRPPASDVFVAGYAFAGDCGPLFATVLRDGVAQAVAKLDPCAAATP